MASQTIDYDALAKQHGAISSTPPPQASGGIDYDALAKQHGAIASTPPPALKEPEGSAAGRFMGNLVSNSPLGMLTGKTARVMVDLAHHAFNGNLPYSPETQEMLGGMVQSHIDQAQKAKAALDRGDKMEAFGHSLATLVPMLGPAAAAAGEKIGGEPGKTDKYGNVTQQGEAPDIAGGVGAGLGVISNVFAPDAVKPAGKVAAKIPGAVARAVVPKLESTLNPVEQGAVDFARREGVPLTPGTITGNKFVKALQATTQNSPLGAQTAAEFNRGTEAGVQRVAGKLADEAHPEPVTPESVGRAIPAKLQKTINDLGQQADAHYEKAWQGRDDPQHTYNMPVGMKDTPFLDEAGRPTGESEQRPVMKPVNMPVDVRDIKAQAKPLYDEMQWMPASDRAASAGYQAVKNILEGDDFIPAWQAEKGLGGLKTLARTDSLSGVRNTSQGIAAGMIPNLQDAVNAAVANTGDEAIRGLQQGRATHARMMGVADLADQLRDEPVQNFGKLTWQGDTGIDFLRKIQEQAPEHMAPLGRAFVQQMIDKATEGGGFNKTQNLLNRWNAMGDATKEILYPDPQLRQNLGKFFKAADMVAQNPNPSGTALVQSAVSISPLRWAAGYLGSKLFFTPEGISLLTDAVKPQSPGSAALMRAKVRAAAGPGAPPEEPPPQPGGPKSPPPAGPGGAPGNPTPANPGAAALDTASRRAQETIASSKAKLTGTPKPAETPAPEPGILEAYPERAIDEETPAGSATEVSVPGSGRSYQAQYEVRELDDLQASHNGKTFQPNPKYALRNDRDYTRAANQGKVVQWSAPGEFDPRYLVNDNPDASNGAPVVDADGNVLGGNGRKMILDRVFSGDSKGTRSYTDLLNQKAAQFGIDPETVRGMRKPVLVRVVDNEALPTPAAKQDAITDFNKSGTASLRPSEKALADSRRVSPETLDNLGSRLEAKGPDATLADALEGTSGTQVLDRLIDDGVVSPQERAEYVDGPNLTQDGKARISRLMLGRFFEDPSQLDRTPLSIRAKLARVAAPLAQVEGKGEWSLAEPMHQALNLIEAAGGHGLTLNDYLQQGGLFTKQEYGPQAVTLAKRLQNMTQLQLTQAARQYAQDAQFAGHGEGLFGKPPSPDEAFQTAFGVKGLPQEAGTSGAAAMRKAQERNAGKVAARKAKLTGHSDETGTK